MVRVQQVFIPMVVLYQKLALPNKRFKFLEFKFEKRSTLPIFFRFTFILKVPIKQHTNSMWKYDSGSCPREMTAAEMQHVATQPQQRVIPREQIQ